MTELRKAQELSEAEVMDRLRKIKIPNTRELQQILIKNDKTTKSEEQIKKWRGEHTNKPRIFLLQPDIKKTIFSLAIPMSLPNHMIRIKDPETKTFLDTEYKGDYQTWINRKSWFGKWESGSFAPAFCLTTKTGLEKLIEIFAEHKIPMSLGSMDRPFYNKKVEGQALIVPYSWDTSMCGMGDGPDLLEFGFMTFDYLLNACTYIVLSESNEIHQSSTLENHLDFETPSYIFSRSVTSQTSRKISCETAVFCEHSEHTIRKEVEESSRQVNGENNEKIDLTEIKREYPLIRETRRTVIELGDVITVYDPKWIKV